MQTRHMSIFGFGIMLLFLDFLFVGAVFASV
ncbi:hypothetical protein HHE014_08740 [Helicobacter heilmannii]|nr:hypothetical protein HHE014_08740 [Helicobacter heilmannii]